jgi:hypothetical protein
MSEYTDRLIPYVNDARAALFGFGSSSGSGNVFTPIHGSPEGALVGSPGDRAWDLDTGFEYTKIAGVATNTGWAIH